MASLAEIVRTRSSLSPAELAHLQRLVASWNMLADFCFSDLLLFVPLDGEEDQPADSTEFMVVGHVRPSTTQTLYRHDLIGEMLDEDERPLVARAMKLREIIEGEITVSAIRERVRVLCIPVRYEGRTLAVLSRESTPTVGRSPGELEKTYVDIFNRFARMIAHGTFPFATDDSESKESPRVGDGVIVLDRDARVEYASPNAVSALHRMGVHASLEGMRLGALGMDDEPIRDAFGVGKPVTEEVEADDVILVVRAIPMLDPQGVTGGVVLFRDVTEVRRRDRLLLSKDATIREIHHRVKNNLQTISSLLQLQARRTGSDEAKLAIGESVRRIRSIALVHETLSREAGEAVAFTEIVRPLVKMVAEAVSSPERQIAFEVQGESITLPAEVATPMAVVLAELLQNTADHAFADAAPPEGRRVVVDMASTAREVVIRVIDNGAGLPPGFDLEASTGLGLSIVRALVTSDLRGSITMRAPEGGEPGTVVELRVPLGAIQPD
ncbi:MAG: histidine kinase N-terminal domain-containing protein [Acidimicrobiales bacterium]|nr:histidine kinase N-terminal domain-containing protein [Acidimicrobiales bacterium]